MGNQSEMSADVGVLVVGGGPTGLLLAAELVRRGIDCRLIDANIAPLHWDRATVVHARSLEIFESLGIVQPLLDQGARQRIAKIHADGKLLGQIDLAVCGSRYGFNIGLSEEVTESVLTGYLEKLGGRVVRGSKLIELTKGDGKNRPLIATIEREGKRETISAKWVVGCDGIHSATRAEAGIELQGHEITEPWAVFDTSIAGWKDTYEGNFAFLDTPMLIVTALPGHRWRAYLRPRSPGADLVAEASINLRKYLPGARFEHTENPARFHCHSRVAERYRAGHILLAGDAAHVCSPAQGHGMNTGLGDAFNLAWKLALVCQGKASETLLDSYEAERKPIAAYVAKMGDDFEGVLGLKDRDACEARDRAIRGAFADPESRQHEAIAEAELDADYSKSPIVAGETHDVAGAGRHMPDSIRLARSRHGARYAHELAHRAGHTAMLIASVNAGTQAISELVRELESAADGVLIEKLEVLSDTHASAEAAIEPEAAARMGVRETTLLVVRPDGHVGLRVSRDHANAMREYCKALRGEVSDGSKAR